MDISKLHLFEGFGIELEYMIVDRETLDVKPVADQLIKEVAGSYASEIDRGALSWSNELVLHVIELKTNGPAALLQGLHERFQIEVNEINRRLESYNAMLLPSALHPWMDPFKEMKLWPHEYNPVYEAYNRIFDCRGHGWANLQSTHINLPFSGDEEFEKLHAAVRVILPLLPAIAAASPIADGEIKTQADFRLHVYRHNAAKVPSVTGDVIPEPVFSGEDYDREIFQRMYRDIMPHDPNQMLQDEWLNSRGAIARFDRGSIEIRLLDIQECPLADLAVARIIIDTIKALVGERWSALQEQKEWNVEALYTILLNTIEKAENAIMANNDFGRLFGFSAGANEPTARDFWAHLFSALYGKKEVAGDKVLQALEKIIEKGTLSSRIKKALPAEPEKNEIKKVYEQLGECLAEGKLFIA